MFHENRKARLAPMILMKIELSGKHATKIFSIAATASRNIFILTFIYFEFCL